MIHRAKFQNFKALRDVEVTFDSRLTVLVGPNGSGKTSVLEGIQFVGNYALTGQPPDIYSLHPSEGMRQVYGWQALGTCIDMSALKTGTTFEVDEPHDGTVATCRYRCVQGWTGKNDPVSAQQIKHECAVTHSPTRSGGGTFSQVQQVRSATLLRLDPLRLAFPSLPRKLPPETARDGSGLPSTLGYLLRKYPDTYQMIVNALRKVIPDVVGVRLDLESVSGGFGDVLLFDFKGALGVPASSTSDGTLVVLGLISVLLNPEGPRLILLDDLDHRLHPKAQMELVELLRQLLNNYPDLQVIATSHSPYILDRLEPREVRMMALKDDGSAVCRPLTDHPEFERWKESMSPGEFWSTFYEDWLTRKPEPQPAQ